jgi:hypothetical protein
MHDIPNRGGIPAPIFPPETELLRFSFKHLDLDAPKFGADLCNEYFLRRFLEVVRDFSSWTVEQFCDQNNNEHRHVISFAETTEPNGFLNIEQDQLSYHESWQFQLSGRENWRVHGILIDDTFYVISLDPNHALYPL